MFADAVVVMRSEKAANLKIKTPGLRPQGNYSSMSAMVICAIIDGEISIIYNMKMPGPLFMVRIRLQD